MKDWIGQLQDAQIVSLLNHSVDLLKSLGGGKGETCL